MIHYDASAQVYEAFTDAAATEYLGAYDTLSQAREAVAQQSTIGGVTHGVVKL